MGAVLEGFATIGAVIAVGALLAQLRIVDLAAAEVLSRLAFFVASPALILSLMARTDVSHVLSRQLAATVLGVVVPLAVYVFCARKVWQRGLGHTVVGGFSSAYVNAGNLGLPVAAYVLGNATYVVPTLLLQLCVLTPIGVSLLDHDANRNRSRAALLLPVATPLTVAMLLGLLLSLTGTALPGPVASPVELIGAMAVPSMLVAYGISLRLGGGFGAGGARSEIVVTSALKLIVQPAVATARRLRVRPQRAGAARRGDRERAADGPERVHLRQPLRPGPDPGPRHDPGDHCPVRSDHARHRGRPRVISRSSRSGPKPATR